MPKFILKEDKHIKMGTSVHKITFKIVSEVVKVFILSVINKKIPHELLEGQLQCLQ